MLSKKEEICHTKSLAIPAGLFYNKFTIIFQSFSYFSEAGFLPVSTKKSNRYSRKERRVMTYFQFVHAVEMKVKECAAEDLSVYVHSAVKNNGTRRHGLTIAKEDVNIFPTIYLEEYYRRFQSGISLERIAQEILNLYREEIGRAHV